MVELVGEFSEEDLCPYCYRGLEVPVAAHGPVEHRDRYLYILKLDGGQFYVGQTDDLLGEGADADWLEVRRPMSQLPPPWRP